VGISREGPGSMKIALCLEYPISLRGGVSVLVEALARGLARQHHLVLVSPDASPLPSGSLAQCFRTQVVVPPGAPSAPAARALARNITAAGVELAHFHLGANFAWGNRFVGQCPIPHLARLGVPTVTTVHMAVGLFHGFCGPQQPWWFKAALLPLAWAGKLHQLARVSREIVVSQADYVRLRRWYWPARKKFIRIYHSRLDAASPGPAPGARQSIILNVGHVAERKGQPILAEAFAAIASRHPRWRLWLAGHVAEEAARHRIAAATARCPTPDRISLLGERDDTAELMQRAGVYVQPSLHEGLPLALQEALFHGCACVATRIPGNTELLENGTRGLLVPPGEVEQLAQALDQLLSDSRLQQRLATGGRDAIVSKGMTAPHMVEQHLRLYDSVWTEFHRRRT
jgi:glycosyltransferase involved in cell wall biosynthesis